MDICNLTTFYKNLNQVKGDSCISQLLATTHEIHSSFDAIPSFETRYVSLDISKSFDRVWHEGLLFKLKSMV